MTLTGRSPHKADGGRHTGRVLGRVHVRSRVTVRASTVLYMYPRRATTAEARCRGISSTAGWCRPHWVTSAVYSKGAVWGSPPWMQCNWVWRMRRMCCAPRDCGAAGWRRGGTVSLAGHCLCDRRARGFRYRKATPRARSLAAVSLRLVAHGALGGDLFRGMAGGVHARNEAHRYLACAPAACRARDAVATSAACADAKRRGRMHVSALWHAPRPRSRSRYIATNLSRPIARVHSACAVPVGGRTRREQHR